MEPGKQSVYIGQMVASRRVKNHNVVSVDDTVSLAISDPVHQTLESGRGTSQFIEQILALVDGPISHTTGYLLSPLYQGDLPVTLNQVHFSIVGGRTYSVHPVICSCQRADINLS